jgi:hypothetical protein
MVAPARLCRRGGRQINRGRWGGADPIDPPRYGGAARPRLHVPCVRPLTLSNCNDNINTPKRVMGEGGGRALASHGKSTDRRDHRS